jgi:predicted nucleic-acid-binding protein
MIAYKRAELPILKAVKISADSAADLVDHLIAELAQAAGCHLTYTFDRAASRAAGMRLL